MFNNTIMEMQHHVNDAVLPVLPPGWQSNPNAGCLSVKTTYINTLGFPVTIVQRSGLRSVIEVGRQLASETNACFTIRQEIHVTSDGWNQLEVFLQGLPADKYQYLRSFREQWENMKRNNAPGVWRGNPRIVVVDWVVPANAFFNCVNLYYRNQDLVISRRDILSAPPHPEHPDAAPNIELPNRDTDTDPSANTAIQLELIEGNEPLAARYIAISDKVFRIVPKKDTRRTPGLYLTSLQRDAQDNTRTVSVQERYALEEMEEKLGVFKTPEDAITAGDRTLQRKNEILDKEHELQMARRELETIKLDNDRTTRELDAQTRRHNHELATKEHQYTMEKSDASQREQRLKSEMAMFKEASEREKMVLKDHYDQRTTILEHQAREAQAAFDRLNAERKLNSDYERDRLDWRATVRKDQYEERSHERKEKSELVKFLPALIVGIGAVALAAFKFFFTPTTKFSY